MNKKYRLLKDLPGIKAGIVSIFSDGNMYCFKEGEGVSYYSEYGIKKNPDWFEEVKEAIYTEEDMINAYNLGHDRIRIKEFSDLIRSKAQ